MKRKYIIIKKVKGHTLSQKQATINDSQPTKYYHYYQPLKQTPTLNIEPILQQQDSHL